MPSDWDAVPAIRHYGAAMLSSRRGEWGSVRATVIGRERIREVVQRFRLPWHSFRLGISGDIQPGSTTRLGAMTPAPLASHVDRASFYPAGTEIVNTVTGASRLTYLMVEIETDLLGDEHGLPTVDFVPVLELQDPLCLTLLDSLRREVEQPAAAQRLFGETTGLLLLLAISRSLPMASSRRPAGTLGPRQLARVTDYIADNLAEEISLAELARLVGLSRTHLCRAFKASTGTTPHRWQIRARIERAKLLICRDNMPLALVAAATGFADQPHFTNAFRRIAGVTPSRWRRSLG